MEGLFTRRDHRTTQLTRPRKRPAILLKLHWRGLVIGTFGKKTIVNNSNIMKKINIYKSGKNPAEQMNTFGNLLGTLGNNNIRRDHINFLETKLKENNESSNNAIATCPYYYSWIAITAEHIFWEIRVFCFHHNYLKNQSDLTHEYNKLLKVFYHKCIDMDCYANDNDEVKIIYDKLVSFLMMRHAHTHGGFPNPFPASLENLKKLNKPKIRKTDEHEYFTREEVINRIEYFANPSNFDAIKNEFLSIENFMHKAKPYSISF